MTTHFVKEPEFTALTITAPNGATLNVERTDDGRVSAWIAPPGGNDGPSVQLGEADVASLVAYLSAGTPAPIVSADIAAIRRRVAEWEKATGPGGDKAWLAGLLAKDARTLLSEIDRMHEQYAAAHNALRSLAVAYVDATGQPAPVAVNS